MRRTVPAVLGLLALLCVLPAGAAHRRTHGNVVEYWIGAVPINWNVVPTGKDPMTGQIFDPAKTTLVNTAIYRPFSANWQTQLQPGNQGLVGPIIHARAGDTILVHFKNFDTKPHSMHFHGVHYDIESDGAYIPGISGPGADVPPGGTFTYKLEAGDDSVGVWPYHDHSPTMMDSITGGMYGALSILGK